MAKGKAKMQLREKIGGLFMVGFDGTTPPQTLIELIRDQFVGGVILYRRNIKSRQQLVALIDDIKAIADDRPIFVAVDHEGGRVFRLPPPFTQIGPMSQVKDPKTAYEVGKVMAKELSSAGFNINFAPVLDINTNIKNPIIGNRAFSHNAAVVANLGAQLIHGLQENGLIACGKHFPGHGDTFLDSHYDLPRLAHTMKRLTEVELVPFTAAIEAGVKSIMTAHVIYDGIDGTCPATMSKAIINDLLRRRLGFDGVVFTDDLQMAAISRQFSMGEASLLSLLAGCDVCLISKNNAAQKEAIEYVVNAANSGRISESLIDRSCQRIGKLLLTTH